MGLRIASVQSNLGHSGEVGLIGEVDRCPWCRRHVTPRRIGGFARGASSQTPGVDEIYQCANNSCGRAFVASFNGRPGDHATLAGVTPRELETPSVPEEVAKLSPSFAEVYSQAFAAESLGLDQLTGVGLRKALEFLVKNFAIAEHPGEKVGILAKQLAPCIRDYIKDASVKQVAERAVWLGNDETHYLRRWQEKDIGDLKTLIRLVINGIDNVLLTKKYVADMPAGKS
jgi:hypothetical protein